MAQGRTGSGHTLQVVLSAVGPVGCTRCSLLAGKLKVQICTFIRNKCRQKWKK